MIIYCHYLQKSQMTEPLLLYGGLIAVGLFLLGTVLRVYKIVRFPSSPMPNAGGFTSKRMMGFFENITLGWIWELRMQAIRRDMAHYVVGLVMHIPVILLLLFGTPAFYWSQLIGVQGWPLLPSSIEAVLIVGVLAGSSVLLIRRVASLLLKDALSKITYPSDVLWLVLVVLWASTYAVRYVTYTGWSETIFLTTSFAFIAIFPNTKFMHAILLWFTKGLHGWNRAALDEAKAF